MANHVYKRTAYAGKISNLQRLKSMRRQAMELALTSPSLFTPPDEEEPQRSDTAAENYQ